MSNIQEIKKLVLKTAKIEQTLTPRQKIRLAKKRLMKLADIDDSMLEQIKRKSLEENVNEKKEEVVTKFELLEDITQKADAEPNNKTLQEEVDRKEDDLHFSIEDLARAEKEKKSGDPLADEDVPHIAKKKKANVDDAQSYNGKPSEDKTDISDESMDDDTSEKKIKEIDDKERFIPAKKKQK